jgi:hypothetical protein
MDEADILHARNAAALPPPCNALQHKQPAIGDRGIFGTSGRHSALLHQLPLCNAANSCQQNDNVRVE